MKYINYMPKVLKLIGYTVFGNSVYENPKKRIYEVSDDYVISYNKGEFVW